MARGKRYTITDIRKIRSMRRRGCSMEQIAAKTGRTEKALEVLCSRLGWTKETLKKSRRPYTDTEDRLIWQWRDDGKNNKQIAAGLGRTHNAVCKRISTVGI